MKSHGMSKTPLYSKWIDMRKRCYNPKTKSYKDYGKRGITVCDEWRNNFEAFMEWSIANGYQEGLTIDRIDNSKGYSPDNCRFVNIHIQQNNKTNNVYVTHNGITKTIADWSKEFPIPYEILRHRIVDLKMNLSDAINYKPNHVPEKRNNDGKFSESTSITIGEETKSLREWCNIYNAPYQLVWKRYYMRNWDIVDALTTPSRKTKS